jgi:hypothetical protein
MSYSTADLGGVDENSLRVFWYNSAAGRYELVPGDQNIGGGTAVFKPSHFSTFRIIGSYITAGFGSLRAYPNPFDPGSAVNGTFKVTGMPADCELQIFTVGGERIRRILESGQTTPNAGWIEWDGKNEAGEPVGQGVYIYVIKSPAGDRLTGKVGLARK